MKKHNNKTRIKKKKSSILIRVIKKNKNSPKKSRERERERVITSFVWEKYGLNGRNDIKFTQIK